MSADESNSTSGYAPKSPDLSSFYSASPTLPASQQLGHPSLEQQQGERYKDQRLANPYSSSTFSSTSSYIPPGLNSPTSHPVFVPDWRAYHSPPSAYSAQQQQHYISSSGLPPFDHPSRAPYGYKGSFSRQRQERQQPHTPDHQQTAHYRHQPIQPGSSLIPGASVTSPSSTGSVDMPPRRRAAAAAAAAVAADAAASSSSPPPSPPLPPSAPAVEPSPVKTKFPTARIKRIMQADEEVGKVAQQAPIAVGKALELFMVQLVNRGAEVARDKGARKVTAAMLKQVIETEEQWDFLREIVSRVDLEKDGSRAKAKTESESDEEVVEPKRRGRGGGRKKKE
ncbi:hypothetical protein CDD82_6259 [Ophiocordyceps australis]|uniref:Transcription factor CBF/NF-Y/archaeal histone domain-containing protein n=1 Tax=Ophiocordyceps australis TaxID=1399860 RepID=A0A2C5ZMR1_9HYPO|nr:hypothetical protein CDD82_6259 [Ophiocordyceps australis]